jgi:ferredoxin
VRLALRAIGFTVASRAESVSNCTDTVRLVVRDGDETREFAVELGVTLRDALLDRGLSPYAPVTERLNCGGRGICATCGVRIADGETAPEHWHDRLADRFGYPRLSCQITVDQPMTVALVEDKRVWGGRKPTGDE